MTGSEIALRPLWVDAPLGPKVVTGKQAVSKIPYTLFLQFLSEFA
jgi:hypothetical protein